MAPISGICFYFFKIKNIYIKEQQNSKEQLEVKYNICTDHSPIIVWCVVKPWPPGHLYITSVLFATVRASSIPFPIDRILLRACGRRQWLVLMKQLDQSLISSFFVLKIYNHAKINGQKLCEKGIRYKSPQCTKASACRIIHLLCNWS